jgi:hypothetical protein
MAALAEEIARRKAAAALTDLGEEDTSEGAELDPNSEPDPDDSADTETPADKEVPSVQTTTVTRAPARFNPNAQTLADYFGPPSGPAAPPRSAKDQSGEIPGESLTDDSGKLAGPLTLSAEAAIREGRPTPTPVKLNP